MVWWPISIFTVSKATKRAPQQVSDKAGTIGHNKCPLLSHRVARSLSLPPYHVYVQTHLHQHQKPNYSSEAYCKLQMKQSKRRVLKQIGSILESRPSSTVSDIQEHRRTTCSLARSEDLLPCWSAVSPNTATSVRKVCNCGSKPFIFY